jgi:hypothetical protein
LKKKDAKLCILAEFLCTFVTCNNLKEVEDELHFLIMCPKYNNERLQLVESVSKINSNFSFITPAEKLMWILNNESKEVLCLLGKRTNA